MTTVEKVGRLVESRWVVILSRLSMIAVGPMLTIIVGLAAAYGNNLLQQQEAATARVSARVDRLESTVDAAGDSTDALRGRITTVEVKIERGQADREKFQDQTLASLGRLNDSVSLMAQNVAALTATVQAMKEDRARAPPGR